jgi:outer membrane phospholipase A
VSEAVYSLRTREERGSMAKKAHIAALAIMLTYLWCAVPGEAPAAEPAQEPPATRQRDDGMMLIGGAVIGQISAFEPVYFAYGWRGQENAKFQVSFKYQFSRGFFLGYTQTSVWDLGTESEPFHDSSYRPSIFYVMRRDRQTAWQAGYEHESNGKAGTESRSIDILFLRPMMDLGSSGRYRLILAPKVWAYADKSENPDIQRYRGYADLFVLYEMQEGFGIFDGLQLSASARRGMDKHYGSVQVDLSYPLGKVVYAYVQYFSGWGETILDYNRRLPFQVRVSVMLARW